MPATGGQRVRRRDRVIANPMFDAAYGVPRDLTFIARHNAANLILRGDAAALARVVWVVAYGPESHEPWQSNYYRGEHLLACPHVPGLANTSEDPVILEGDHTRRIADRLCRCTTAHCAMNHRRRPTVSNALDERREEKEITEC